LRLLILSCSKAKRRVNGRVAALNLYDGPAFRVLRRFFLISDDVTNLDVLILSARYGFISPEKPIATYDQRMRSDDEWTTAKLRSQFTAMTVEKNYSEVFINLGLDYLSRLPDVASILHGRPVIHTAQGRIGEKLHDMKEWLFHC
jgi:hypothetical protein